MSEERIAGWQAAINRWKTMMDQNDEHILRKEALNLHTDRKEGLAIEVSALRATNEMLAGLMDSAEEKIAELRC